MTKLKTLASFIEQEQKLLNAATPGPWTAEYAVLGENQHLLKSGLPLYCGLDVEEGVYADNSNDFDFIANVRTSHALALEALQILSKFAHKISKVGWEEGDAEEAIEAVEALLTEDRK